MTVPIPAPAPPDGPCDWPVVYLRDPDCTADWSAVQRETFESMATTYLWNWTARQFGPCPVALRPCRADCDGFTWFAGLGPYTQGAAAVRSRGGTWGPVLLGGKWFNVTCGSCGDNCSCSGNTEALRLPGPIAEVTSVMIDGQALPITAYRVDNASVLVRTDNLGWPVCQDMSLAPTEEGTWEINYTQGLPVPAGGQVAAGVLACELGKAATGDSSCQLPRRLQTIARQGVTMTFLDAMDDLDKGRTGIWLIDSWVASVMNPPRPSQVYSPDIPRPRNRVTTWSAG